MTDMITRIEALTPDQATRVLKIAASAVRDVGAPVVIPDHGLAKELANAAKVAPEASASDGELAKVTLLLLADDPKAHTALLMAIEHRDEEPTGRESFDPITLGLGVAALVVLQSYIKIERDQSGKWTFKFEKKPMSDKLLGQVISKLGSWVGLG
jgi:hypothetical protein